MHRIDTPGHLSNLFSSGNPLAVPPVDATVIGDTWLNTIQEELAYVVENGTGLTLDKLDNTQVLEGLQLQVLLLLGGRQTVTAPSALTAGDVFMLEDTVFVAKETVAINDPVIAHSMGRETMPKISGSTINLGDALYWDDGAGNVSKFESGNYYVGRAAETVGTGVSTIDVYMAGAPMVIFP